MADVAASLKNWSTTASSNSPTDATTVGAGLADNLQQIQATVRNALAHKGSDIASNTTTDLGAVEGLFHDITGTTTITGFGTVSAGIWKVIKFEGALTLTHNATSLILPGGQNITTANGDVAVMVSEGSGNWRCVSYEQASGATVNAAPPGAIMDFAGSSAPSGWLECDGSAVSRTTYSRLFAAISTTWGDGDESTTFNLPDFRGKHRIGKGTGTTTEDVTASSSNGFTVTSNNTKWITGMTVVLSDISGFTTTATDGPTYYIVRVSSTNVRLATTLALAQAGSPDITISGTGTATLTHTYTARTLGEYGGQESHAMTSTELLSHGHSSSSVATAGSGTGGANDVLLELGDAATGTAAATIGAAGGNAAMNVISPFGAVMTIIKY